MINILWYRYEFIYTEIFSTLRQRDDDHHLADELVNWICLIKNVCILIEITQKFVPGSPI